MRSERVRIGQRSYKRRKGLTDVWEREGVNERTADEGESKDRTK